MAGKIAITDDVLAPYREITLNYKGPEPFKATEKIKGVLQRIFEVTSSGIVERDMRWDASGGDTKKFFYVINATPSQDGFTKMYVDVKMEGTQSSTTRQGTLRVVMSGTLITTFDYNNFLRMALMRMYYRMFYKDKRMIYLKKNYEKMVRMQNDLRAMLGLPPKEIG